jgi:hypothetical protein
MDISVDYQTYNGGFALPTLFGFTNTIFLGDFGPMNSGTLSDASGLMYVGETVTIDGTPYTMRGSGTAQPGVDFLGMTIPTGTAVDLVLLEDQATGDLVFTFPDGVPNALGIIALVVELDAVGYNIITLTPLCFLKGTRILTTEGEKPVQSLERWDTVVDFFGEVHQVLFVSHITLSARRAIATGQAPVKVVKDALGPDCPRRSVSMSPNHCLFLEDPAPGRLVPVKTLIDGEKVKQTEAAKPVDYFHVLVPVHAILMADGLPAESLLLSDLSRASVPEKAAARYLPRAGEMTPAAPVMRRRDVEEENLWL